MDKIRRTVLNCPPARLALVILLLVARSAAAQVVVDSRLENGDIAVGAQAALTTTVTAARGAQVQFPEYATGDTLMTGVEVVRMGRIDTADVTSDRIRLSRTYTITSFDSALYALPSMTVMVDGKPYRSRGNLGLKVTSIPVDTVHVDQLAPAYAVVEAPFVWSNSLLILTLLPLPFFFLLLYAAINLTGRKPLRRRVVVTPPTPPATKALAALTALAAESLEAKAFFIRLTDIARLYLFERYGFNAMEKTTAEIVAGLRDQLDRDVLRRFADIFTTADLVKFAKHSLDAAACRSYLDSMIALVDATRDAAMEQQQPTVEYVTYSDVHQHRRRLVLWGVLVVSVLALVGMLVFAAITVINVYL